MQTYNDWALATLNQNVPAPTTWPAISWALDNKYGQLVHHAMMEVERVLAKDLISELDQQGVPGVIVEFGIFQGYWIEKLIEIVSELGDDRQILGFDSFEGLPATTQDDLDCWHEGQYKASYEQVYERLQIDKHKNAQLIKGWFKDTLELPAIQAIEKVSYARVDCDLYEPTVSVLLYLQTRLAHNSVLILDDWTFNIDKGETKAFYEWVNSSYVKENLKFEFICFHGVNHYYLRVLRNP